MRTKEYRINVRKKKIKERKEKSISKTPHNCIISNKEYNILYGSKEGLLSKCYYGTIGGGIKTKTKNAYASYRHKGGYGKAKRYSKHDNTQIIRMNQELKDYCSNSIND